jgi:diguanylate cyclase (GGDEF)-like protein/PAS domain S-box-containing protein
MAFVCVISLLAAAGWVFNRPVLASLNPEFIPMAPATALIFLGLCGAWLIHRVYPSRGGIRKLVQAGLLGMLIIVIILALRYFTGLGPDLEKILYPAPPLFGQFSSARMSPLSALGFLLAIPAFLLLTGGKPGMRTKTASAALSLALFILSGLICLGYLYGAPPFYGGTLIPVAITSALSFWFLSLGLLMMAGPSCWPLRMFEGHSLKARLMRTFIPASLLIVLLQGLLSTAADPWVINPAIKVGIAAFVACLIVMLIISLIANNISAEIERGRKAEETLQKSEEHLRLVTDNMQDLVVRTDLEGLILYASPSNKTALGYAPEYLLGKSIYDFMHPEDIERVREFTLASLQTQTPGKQELRYRHADGHYLWLESTGAIIFDEGGLPSGAVFNSRDITERKRFESVQNALYRITQTAITGEGIDALYHSIHSILGEMIPAENFFIALIDPASNLISFPYYIDQYDEPPSAPTQIQGLTGYVLRTGRSLLATRELFDRLVQQGEVEVVGTVFVDWMGAPLKVEGRMIGVMAVQSYTQEVHFDQEDLNLLEFVSTQVAQAIERKRMEQEIRNLSLTDEVTGLYNRRGFTLLAEQEVKLAHRKERSMLFFFADVDNLKAINDNLGHAQGDLALKEVSVILKETFREADILARFGGDEFVVLAVDASLESAEVLTNRIQVTLERRNQGGDRPYQLTLSMGVARYDPEAPCTVSELIAQADGLMYDQKQAGKGKK